MKHTIRQRTSNYFLNHFRAICYASGEMIKQPFSNFLTILVIAIAIALPFGLSLLLSNLAPISSQINTQPKIAVYTQAGLSPEEVNTLKNQISAIPEVAESKYTSPDEGLKDFLKFNHLTKLTSTMQPNPLPGVFAITPALAEQSPADVAMLIAKVENLPNVSTVKLNMTWIKRLYYLVNFSQRIVITLGLLFSIGVFLIVGNTIRLITQKNKSDINIMRLFGASPGFIRRPYFYRGLLLGLLGGIMAWLMVSMFLNWLSSPLQSFTATYFNTLNINNFSYEDCLKIIAFSVVISTLATWIAVRPYLSLPEE